MPDRERVKLEVEADLDPVAGVFSTPESAEMIVGRILRESIPHYNPTVKIIKED